LPRWVASLGCLVGLPRWSKKSKKTEKINKKNTIKFSKN